MNFVEHKQTHEANDFIRGWYIDTTICDNLIDYFESSDQKVAGTGSHGLDETQKKSTDVVLQDSTLYEAYGVEIQKVFEEYMKIYPFVNEYWPWGIVEEINLQRYYPGEGFYRWHTERTGLEDSNRHLVFMTYLNDVADAGETEFLHQNTKVKPEKGLTLVWPADWTFTHRGCVSKTETKYILTGWASYYNKIGN